MRRIIATLACAAAAALVAPALATPAHAQARATDPVAALKKQFVAGHGVHLTSVGKISMHGLGEVKFRQKGDVEFGRSGVAASDTTSKTDFGTALGGNDGDLQGLNDPTRTIIIKNTGYMSGGIFASVLPEGKSWLRMPGMNASDSLAGGPSLLNTLDARALKAVLATTKAKGNGGVLNGAKTVLYRGSITMQQLYSSSPSLKKQLKLLTAQERKTPISWKLWVGADKLVRRVATSAHLPLKIKKKTYDMAVSGVTTFTGWGSKIAITAPPADEVADFSDIDGTLPEMPDYINLGD